MQRWLVVFVLFIGGSARAAEDYITALEFYHSKHYSDAFRILKPLTTDEEVSSRASLLIGTMYFDRKKLKQAKKLFDRAHEEDLTRDTAFAWSMKRPWSDCD